MTETQSQFAGAEDMNPNTASGVLLDDIVARIRIPPRIRWPDGTVETDDSLRGRVLGAIKAALPPSDAALDHAGHSVGLPGCGGAVSPVRAGGVLGHAAAPANPENAKGAPCGHLYVRLNLDLPQHEHNTQMAETLCRVALCVVTGMTAGTIENAAGVTEARFWTAV